MQISLVSSSAHLELVSGQPFVSTGLHLDGPTDSASYLPLIAHLRQVIAGAHKKAYTISVGKLNPAKLANFAEIECFVLVACPENSLVDAKVVVDIYLITRGAFRSTLTSPGLLQAHRDAFRTAARVTAFANMDWRVYA